jgi:single-strand DNA-binding protein
MRSINRVMIVGNIGNDPVVKTYDDGFKVVRLSIATTERWTDKRTGDRQSKTEWHTVSVVNPKIIAAVFEPGYVRKGNAVMIEGTLRTSRYQKDGEDRYSTEVQVGMAGSFSNLSPAPAKTSAEPAPQPEAAPVNDDVPF